MLTFYERTLLQLTAKGVVHLLRLLIEDTPEQRVEAVALLDDFRKLNIN